MPITRQEAEERVKEARLELQAALHAFRTSAGNGPFDLPEGEYWLGPRKEYPGWRLDVEATGAATLHDMNEDGTPLDFQAQLLELAEGIYELAGRCIQKDMTDLTEAQARQFHDRYAPVITLFETVGLHRANLITALKEGKEIGPYSDAVTESADIAFKALARARTP